jgi:serine/threonine protein kinase
VKNLILKMLDKDPLERIVMIDWLDHKWFKMTEDEILEEQKEIEIDL